MTLLSKKPPKGGCLSGFENVNRYWDRHRECYVAKILPGEFYATKNNELIATTLGSCVSACIWDHAAAVGGMNHFMLPLTDLDSDKVVWGNVSSDATRYGNYAMEHLINELLLSGASRKRLQAKVFGGARVIGRMSDVGEKNAEFVLAYLETENIPVVSKDLKDQYPRKVIFNPLTGQALMKKLQSIHNDTIVVRERTYQECIKSESVDGGVELF